MKCCLLVLFFITLISINVTAQTVKQKADSTIQLSTNKRAAKDSIIVKDSIPKHDPHKATLRSALIPGWGQAYNGEYWKIPLVYTAIGIPAGFFIYNNTWYKRTKKAFEILIIKDTNNYPQINSKLQGLDASTLLYYRNQFRRDRDYSILYTLIAWGLNVADATVFAHLKDFDVSSDLSFSVKPAIDPVTKSQGFSFVLATKKPAVRKLSF